MSRSLWPRRSSHLTISGQRTNNVLVLNVSLPDWQRFTTDHVCFFLDVREKARNWRGCDRATKRLPFQLSASGVPFCWTTGFPALTTTPFDGVAHNGNMDLDPNEGCTVVRNKKSGHKTGQREDLGTIQAFTLRQRSRKSAGRKHKHLKPHARQRFMEEVL